MVYEIMPYITGREHNPLYNPTDLWVFFIAQLAFSSTELGPEEGLKFRGS